MNRYTGTYDGYSVYAVCAVLAKNVNLGSWPLGSFSANWAANWATNWAANWEVFTHVNFTVKIC